MRQVRRDFEIIRILSAATSGRLVVALIIGFPFQHGSYSAGTWE
jgi:hypothetical protein